MGVLLCHRGILMYTGLGYNRPIIVLRRSARRVLYDVFAHVAPKVS